MDIEKTLSKWQQEAENRRKESEANLKRICKHLVDTTNIQKIRISYDGMGDSGQIEEIAIEGGGPGRRPTSEPILNEVFEDEEGPIETRDYANQKMIPATYEEALQDIVYSYLEACSPGWEINEGSYGTFIITPGEGTLEIDHYQREVTEHLSQFKFK